MIDHEVLQAVAEQMSSGTGVSVGVEKYKVPRTGASRLRTYGFAWVAEGVSED